MKKKNSEKNTNNFERTLWHPYKLQSLTPKKFAETVEKILKGEYELLNLLPDNKK